MLRTLDSDVEYRNLISMAQQVEHRKVEVTAEIDRLRREHRLALIDFEASQLGRRAAA